MSSVLPGARTWWIAVTGFAAMYLPLYWWAVFGIVDVDGQRTGIWQSEEHGHGALILLVLLWLFWGLRARIDAAPTRPAPGWGWPLLVFGLLLYVVGQVVGISIFMFGSQPFIVAAILLLLRGPDAIRIAWFPIFYFIFMVPLPGAFVDAVTGPLKQWISAIVVELLYRVGYPIGRSGVVLTIGQYELQVADACSGLHSMYSLSALGTLFMYIMARRSKLHNAIMFASILPIAFVANIVRVIALVLITYHVSNEAGQGFLHGAAGIVLMLVALMFFFALDALLERVLGRREPPPATAAPAALAGARMQLKSTAWILAALMYGAAIAGVFGKPTGTREGVITLKTAVPKQFGEWTEVVEKTGQVINPQTEELLKTLYSQILTRTYENRQGYRIMLSMAYGDDQRGGLQAHRPEVCYPAQGFKLLSPPEDGLLATSFGDIDVRRLKTNMGPRDEPVTYWLTVGDHVIRNKFDKRMMEFRLALTGQIPDGLLFRISSIDKEPDRAFTMQQQFVAALLAAVPAETRRQLSGLGAPPGGA